MKTKLLCSAKSIFLTIALLITGLSAAFAVGPANDYCGNETPLTVYGATCGAITTGTVLGATQSIAPISCGGTTSATAFDVWYKFVANSSTHTITVTGAANFDAVVELLNGSCGAYMDCADATLSGGTEVINAIGLTVGTTYYVRVYHWGSSIPSTPTFTICVTTPPPANDDCSGAISLTVNTNATCSGAITGNDAGATQSIAAPPCTGTADDDVWYKFVATSTTHTITVVGSANFDAVVDLRSGPSCSGTNLNCADATNVGGTEVINATGLTVGSTYFVRVYHFWGTMPSTTTFTICITTPPPPAPANDNCSGATILTVYGATCGNATNGNTASATQSLAAFCGGTADDDVWYKFVATATSHNITVVGSSGFDAVVDLRSGACNGSNISCKDSSGTGGTEILRATGLTIGTTYYVRVYDWFDPSSPPTTTTFTICVTTPATPTPANDDCSGATSLTVYGASCGGAVTGNVTGATQSIAPIICSGTTSTTANDIWYKFVATASAHIITVVGSTSFDAVVDLRSGSCSGTNINCADATGTGGTEVINATGLTTGSTYYIRVYHYGSSVPSAPTFTICITTPAPINDNCAGATSLTVYGATCGASTTGNVAGATQSLAATCNGTANDDVWYSFVATATSHTITVVGTSSFDAVIDLRSGSCNGTNISCKDTSAAGGTEILRATGLTVGTTYYVRVYDYGSGVPATTTFTICITTPTPPTPVNDNCSGATSLTVYGATCGGATTGNVTGATPSTTAAISCNNFTSTAANDVWYSFVATSTSHIITVVGSTSFDAVVDLRSGPSCGGTNINCADATTSGGTEVITATGLTAGSTYFVRVYHFGSTAPTTTTFTICITTPAPPNDNCSGATPLTVYGATCGATTTGNVASATQSIPAVLCNGLTGTANDDVWYSFVATATSHNITVVGSASFDAVIDLRTGACSGTNITCKDSTGNGGTEILNATGLTVGSTYFVRIYDYNNNVPATTTFTICITTPLPPTPPNDNCIGAVSLTVYGATCGGAVTGNVAGATPSTTPAISCNNFTSTAANDVWYSFVATSSSHIITVVGSTGFDAVVDLRSSTGSCSGTNINCKDSSTLGGTEILKTSGLTIGSTYFVRVYNYGSTVPSTTTFTICITTPVPANDDCAGAIPLTVYGVSCGATTTGNVASATQSIAAAPCAGTANDDVWYSFVATSTSHIITVAGSLNFDPVIDLRSGSCNGTNISCKDTSGTNGTEIMHANGLTIGSTYYVRVYDYYSGVPATTTFTICITTPAPSTPANNDCSGATSLTDYGASCGGATTGNVASSTQSIAPLTCGSFTSATANDVWYKFIATSTKHVITVIGSANFDAVVELRTGGSGCNGTNTACSDSTQAGGTEVINDTLLTIGTTYYVRVYHWGSSIPATTTFTICVTTPTSPPPANNNCSGATTLTVYGATCGGATTGNVAGATQSIAAITCNGSTGTANDDVWYKFVATASAHTITVVGSASFNAVVDMHSGSCSGPNINCADASGNGGSEVINANGLTIGNTYWVRVYDYGSGYPATTTFTICVNTPSTPPPVNDNCSGATTLTVYGATCGGATTGDVAGATSSTTSAILCNGLTGSAEDDVWYKFVATATSHDITVIGSNSFNAVVDLRSGTCGTNTNMKCADSTLAGGTEVIHATGLTVGNTYFVRVYDFGATVPATTTFTICITTPGSNTPANDECSGATSLTVYSASCGGATTGNVSGATQSLPAITCSTYTSPTAIDVWYSFVATSTSHIITVVGSASFDAVIDLRSGACTGANINCADTSIAGETEILHASGLTIGNTYFVRVYHWGSSIPATTTFTICITTPAPPIPANDNCSGAISLTVYGATCGGATMGNTASATQSLAAITCSGNTGNANDDVWYKFVATATSHNITVVGSSFFNAVVDMHADSCSGPNAGCADATTAGGTEVINATGLILGKTYFVRVYDFGSGTPATTTFTICVTTPPSNVPVNDNCSGAVSLTVYGATCGGATTGDVAGSTQSIAPITCNGLTGTAANDVWYSFIATSTSHDITVVGSASFDAVVDMRSGVCPTGTNINCSNTTLAGGTEVINATGLTIGNAYFVRVYHYGSTVPSTTSFTICITTPSSNAPINDNCSGAISLTVYGATCGGVTNGDVTGATQSIAAITCSGLHGTADDDVWYSFVATATAHTITVVGSTSFNAVIDLRTGTCPGTNVNCADATTAGGTEALSATGLTIGSTYFVRVYDYGSTTPATTTFTICVTTPGPPLPPPANDSCSHAVTLAVSTTTTCGAAVTGDVSGATQSLPALNCNNSSSTTANDVWYKFIASSTSHLITVVGSASFDAVVELRSGSCTSGTNINCADSTVSGQTEIIHASGLIIGTAYFVRVYNWGIGTPATTTFTICITTPCSIPNTSVSPAAVSICSGHSTTLIASGANTYTWMPTSGLNPSTGATVSANPTSTTTYTVTGTSNGCSGTQVATVSVDPASNATITQVQNLLTSTPATTYQWYLDGIIITGANLQNYLVTQNGNYTVVTTNATGCIATSAPFPIISFLGIGIVDGTNVISIHPNPFNTSATIEVIGAIGGNGEVGIKIYDMLGREVKSISQLSKSQSSTNRSGMEFIIERSDLTNGMYFYKLTNKNEFIGSGKFSIQ